MRIKVFLLSLSLSTWYQSQGRKPNSFLFSVSSTPGNLPVTVFLSGHLPHLPILSGQLDRRKKTLTVGKIFRPTFPANFRRRIFPTPTIPEGAPGGDLQLLWRHQHQKSSHAPATRNFPAGGWISRAGAWGHVRPFPATRLILQPRLTPTSIPTSLVLPSEPCTYLFWGFLSPSALQIVFPAKLRLLFLHPNREHVPWEVFFYLSGGTTPQSEVVSFFFGGTTPQSKAVLGLSSIQT